jgi:serine/threonine protein kinase
VQIHDFQVSQPPESDSPTPYMVMAYVEGKTLADYIASTSAQGKIPSPVEIVNIFTSIGLAVDYAHQKGMIHRDIKPANILLDRHNTTRNSMGEPVLTDFGLAKLLGVSAGVATASQPGTPLYTSPEQARGYPGSERSDLYSLGVILFEMVTGVPPFRGDSPTAVLAQHLNATPISPVLLNPNIPPALTLVVMKALAKDPNARFTSATAMTAAIAEALNVSLPESLGQTAYPSDLPNRATHISSPFSQIGIGMASSPVTPAFAASAPSQAVSSGGSIPPGALAGTPLPAPPALQSATPASQQASPLSTPGRMEAGGTPSGPASLPSGAIQWPAAPTPPIIPGPPGPSVPSPSPAGRRWKRLYTGLVVLVLLALIGSSLGVYFTFFHKNNQPTPATGGLAFFLSSGQFDNGTAQGIGDELQINLQHVPDPQPGKSYYAWLLGDKQPQAEKDPLQPAPQFTLPFLIGKLITGHGTATLFFKGTPHHDNLFSLSSRLLVTEENTNGTPRGPSADRGAWRYYAAIPQTPYGTNHLSALDHIRHLFYKETKVEVLGLAGGLDVWLYRNTETILEWANSTRDDYHTQVTDSTLIHNLFLSILDYLDGSPNVQIDVPKGSPIAADRTISRVALLSVVPAQLPPVDPIHNPPGYVDHVQLHLNGVVQAPDATSQMRTLATRIIEALNNAKSWLKQVRAYAQQLVKMDAVQLTQASTLTMLDNMLSNATYAYIGQLDPKTDQLVPGVLQAHYAIQQLATLTITPDVPQNL